MTYNQKEAEFAFKRVKENGRKIVSSPEELAKYYKAGRIEGDVLEYIMEDIKKYGYSLVTHHSSVTGETIFYFDPKITKVTSV